MNRDVKKILAYLKSEVPGYKPETFTKQEADPEEFGDDFMGPGEKWYKDNNGINYWVQPIGVFCEELEDIRRVMDEK